jgi:DNA-binding transcriptional LysR family regulator
MIDPLQFNIFLIAAETLNFSRTAERLNMSQPSVTQNIRRIEQHFGTALFERTGRKLALTEAGMALIPLARQMVAISRRTDELMGALKGEIRGHLKLGCSTTPGKYLLPVLLTEFMRMHPLVQVTCNVTARALAMQALEQGTVQIAFTSTPDEFTDNIEFDLFYSDPLVLIVPLDHPWADLGEISADQLQKASLIMREETSGTHRGVRLGLAKLGIHIGALKNVMTLGNSESIAMAVQLGSGVGFISRLVATHLFCGRVAQVRVKGLEAKQDIFICLNRLYPKSQAQSAFWDYATHPDLNIDELFKTVYSNQSVGASRS